MLARESVLVALLHPPNVFRPKPAHCRFLYLHFIGIVGRKPSINV
jgi:hypothetical protein